jgi:hypothetical protein
MRPGGIVGVADLVDSLPRLDAAGAAGNSAVGDRAVLIAFGAAKARGA